MTILVVLLFLETDFGLRTEKWVDLKDNMAQQQKDWTESGGDCTGTVVAADSAVTDWRVSVVYGSAQRQYGDCLAVAPVAKSVVGMRVFLENDEMNLLCFPCQ